MSLFFKQFRYGLICISGCFLISCSGGSCNEISVVPIPTPTAPPTPSSQIIASYVGESYITQDGGSTAIVVKLTQPVVNPQQIILATQQNQEVDFDLSSNPSSCVLQSIQESCVFTIATNHTTKIGSYTFNLTSANESANLIESTITLAVISPYKFYFAHNGINGYSANLLTQAINSGAVDATTGIQGADYLCNHDESKPSFPQNATYKAMIVDGVNRQACYSFNCIFEGVNENIDWVMHPNAAYKNLQESTVFVTNESGIYIFVPNPDLPSIWTLSNAPMISLEDDFTIDYGVAFMWSGLSSVWTMYPPTSATNNGLCSHVVANHISGYWNSDSNTITGNVGTQISYAPSISAVPSLNPTQIAAGSRTCSESALRSVSSTYINGLICVQQ